MLSFALYRVPLLGLSRLDFLVLGILLKDQRVAVFERLQMTVRGMQRNVIDSSVGQNEVVPGMPFKVVDALLPRVDLKLAHVNPRLTNVMNSSWEIKVLIGKSISLVHFSARHV